VSARRRWPAALALAVALAALLALGTWQVRRLAWKEALIAQVEGRVHAAPVPPPRSVRGAGDAYLRVVATGRYLPLPNTYVRAVTERGPGFWVLTPLRADDGRTILINRGFRPKRDAAPPHPGLVRVVGLLRVTEPGGGFLQTNQPAAERWFSRDVAAIAARRRLERVAPFFVDAESTAPGANAPIGGLTVVRFPNNHLIYAITWYTLAGMAAFALFRLLRRS
jgi:surfeit locus 1 family protein